MDKSFAIVRYGRLCFVSGQGMSLGSEGERIGKYLGVCRE